MRRMCVAACVLGGFLSWGCGTPDDTVRRSGNVTSAGPGQGAEVASVDFESLFELVQEIRLEEPDSALITEIIGLDVDARGRLLIPDPTSGQVRVYAPDGSLLRVLGRRGEGPGEFLQPYAATFAPDGRVYVSDARIPRVTRFDASLAYDTTFALDRAVFGAEIAAIDSGVVVFAMRESDTAGVYDIYSPDGRPKGRFYPVPAPIREVPYWISAARSRLAVGAHSIFVAVNLLYPVHRYDEAGEALGEFGVPPASWQPASRPEAGAFVGPGARAGFERWRRTFTTIGALGVLADSLLLVVHERLDPELVEYEAAAYRLDIYRLSDAPAKLYEDVPMPGRMLHAGDALYVLLANPAERGGWILGRYRTEVEGQG